ncbi:MAG: GDP-mannose 4,6-dehydratase [Phycisphaerae bacterium]|nr:GDP-mannose 4,6-dehydratase [Phycisphaerae bacterium]
MAANRLLVTGATGFVGKWVLRHWRDAHPEVKVWATSDQPIFSNELPDTYSVLDLRDANGIRDFVRHCNPTHVIHLAGLMGAVSLAEHLSVNVLGTENIYNALVEIGNSAEVRIVQAGTAAIYGKVAPNELPIKENNPLRPLTAYGISKMTQDCLAEMFWRTRGLSVIRARIFNLLGPGQPTYLVPATFVKQLKTLCDGESLQVGNLDARRDFVDVRDAVRAFDSLLIGGRDGGAYNIASGASFAIRDVLNELLTISGLHDISIREESARMRRADVPDVYANTAAIAGGDSGHIGEIERQTSLMARGHRQSRNSP